MQESDYIDNKNIAKSYYPNNRIKLTIKAKLTDKNGIPISTDLILANNISKDS